MPLQGFDVSLELGRSGINKMLAGIERLPVWVGRFHGNTHNTQSGILSAVHYEATLSNLRLRPDEEQGNSPRTTVVLMIDVSGDCAVDMVAASGEVLLHAPFGLDGELSVVVDIGLTVNPLQQRLFISFARAAVQHLVLRNLPDDVARILTTGGAFLLQEELRNLQQDLPITGIMALSGSPQGLLEGISYKTHFYKTIPADTAVGLAAVFEPGAAPLRARHLTGLVRCADQDLVVSATEDYLNRVAAVAIADGTLSGGQILGSKPAPAGFHIRSVSVDLSSGDIHAVVRAGWGQTEVAVDVTIRARVDGDRVRLDLVAVRTELASWRGFLLEVCLNVLAWLILVVADCYLSTEIPKRLAQVETYADGLAINSKAFQRFPEGIDLRTTPAVLLVADGVLTIGYRIVVDVQEALIKNRRE